MLEFHGTFLIVIEEFMSKKIDNASTGFFGKLLQIIKLKSNL